MLQFTVYKSFLQLNKILLFAAVKLKYTCNHLWLFLFVLMESLFFIFVLSLHLPAVLMALFGDAASSFMQTELSFIVWNFKVQIKLN